MPGSQPGFSCWVGSLHTLALLAEPQGRTFLMKPFVFIADNDDRFCCCFMVAGVIQFGMPYIFWLQYLFL